jgi:hypothetical protein
LGLYFKPLHMKIYCLYKVDLYGEVCEELLTWWKEFPTIEQLNALLDVQIVCFGNVITYVKGDSAAIIFLVTLISEHRAEWLDNIYTIKTHSEGEKL